LAEILVLVVLREGTKMSGASRTRRLVPKALLALATLSLAGVLLLALSSGPAEAATTFTVNKTGDADDRNINGVCDTNSKNGRQCTLRAAIEEANATQGADTIDFDISGAKTTIKPESQLPTIFDSVTIDGYTQQGASPNTLAEGNDAVLKVKLTGSDAGTNANPSPHGLVIGGTSDSTIKGLVINRFGGNGIRITGSGATDNKVEGNFIGTNEDGTTDKGNGTGVFVFDAANNTVGGTQPDMRNIISGNDLWGVFMLGSLLDGNLDGNRIEGNFIGTTADGSGDLGNTQDGVVTQGTNNVVGGIASGAGNRIAHNGGNGVEVSGSDSAGNNVLSNSIFSNGELGIDLNNDGITANDTDDPDAGSNNLQNFPVITSVIGVPPTSNTLISGTLNSTPSLDFVVQCFLTDGASVSDHGEGSVLLDTTVATTDANGDGGFFCISSNQILGQIPGQTVSATATNILTTGDTSEFSENEPVPGPGP
jgi:hypothetical protein